MSANVESVPAAAVNGGNGVPDVLTPAEAAAYLRLPEDVVAAELAAGRLPGRRVGGQWRVGRAALLAWLGTPDPRPEPPPTDETPEEQEAFLATLRAYRDEVDRATGFGRYAAE